MLFTSVTPFLVSRHNTPTLTVLMKIDQLSHMLYVDSVEHTILVIHTTQCTYPLAYSRILSTKLQLFSVTIHDVRGVNTVVCITSAQVCM